MRNVVLTTILFAACGPHPTNPQTTEGDTETLGGLTYETTTGLTDGVSATTNNPTTEVNGSTGMPDTDDPVLTTLPTTSTSTSGEPPACATPVMCGDKPCLTMEGEPICAPGACPPRLCDDCPAASFCGQIPNGPSVCVVDDKVPCESLCTPILCEFCPYETCDASVPSLCLNPATNQFACVQDHLFCPHLGGACAEDAHCGGGAPNCIDGVCRAACEADEDCGLKSLCLDGICVDAENHPVCAVIPHEPPPPPCEPNGQCMSDIDCPTGASVCWDFTTQAPVVAGEIGNCVAPCTDPSECAETDTCVTLGFCVNDALEPTCSPE